MAGSRPRDEAARRTALAPGVSRLRLERNCKRSEVCLHQGKNSRNSPSALSNSTFLWKTAVFPNKKNTQRAVAVSASLIRLPPSCPWRPAPCAGRERGPGHGCPAAARWLGLGSIGARSVPLGRAHRTHARLRRDSAQRSAGTGDPRLSCSAVLPWQPRPQAWAKRAAGLSVARGGAGQWGHHPAFAVPEFQAWPCDARPPLLSCSLPSPA